MKKALVIGIGLLVMIFWGGVIMEVLAEGVKLGLEVAELVTEELLEGLLALTPYEAQLVTAWLGFGLAALLLIIGLKKFNTWWQRFRLWQSSWWAEEKVRLEEMRSNISWPLAVVGLLALLVLVIYL